MTSLRPRPTRARCSDPRPDGAALPVERPWRRRIGAAAPAVVAVLLLTGPAPGAAASAGVRVLQLNLCGSGFAACYTGRAVARAAAVIRSRRPDVVTLNEVCADDLPVLRRALAGSRRTGSVAGAFTAVLDRRTGAPVRCRSGRLYGLGVLAWSPSPAARPQVRTGTYRIQDPGQPEQRAWLCLSSAGRAASAESAPVACTTHLSSGGTGVAVAQYRELVSRVLPALRVGRRGLVVGGDLNLTGVLGGCRPPGYRDAGQAVQHVVAAGFEVRDVAAVDMRATTDHTGLLAVLTRARPGSDPSAPVLASNP